jgi:hypothetical protein
MIELKRDEMDAAAQYVEICRGDFGPDVPKERGHGIALLVYAMPMTRRMCPGWSTSLSMK